LQTIETVYSPWPLAGQMCSISQVVQDVAEFALGWYVPDAQGTQDVPLT